MTRDFAGFGHYQMAERVGLSRSEVNRARELGLLPIPDIRGRRWSLALVEQIAETAEQTREYLATEYEATAAWARAMLQPAVAVILDTETAKLFGAIVEIAVIDVATGTTLLDTLVNPGIPIQPAARAVHGIADADVAGAPTWADLLPQALEATADRRVLSYNATYDLKVVRADCARTNVDPGHLGDTSRWDCIMRRRSASARSRRWLPLGGSHRALGDAHAARAVLTAMGSLAGAEVPD
ncbi:MAG: 3'-5' exonuclease [Dactylosporangium sp.]|nr:3'-5' exonuclease [Dactylosporangium sp.]